MGQCIFCEAVGKLTREHIWADWLKEYIAKDKLNYTINKATVWGGGHISNDDRRRIGGDIKSRRVECVCASDVTYPKGSGIRGCNDGWMSDLQELAKPIIIPLAAGQTIELGERQQKVLAAWIAMAVMCSEFGKHDSVTIPQEDRTILFKHRVPPRLNWAIWIGDYERGTEITEWARHVLTITNERTRRSTLEVRPPLNTQTTTYMVGRLYIHCFSSAFGGAVRAFRFARELRPFVVQIWPLQSAIIKWPPSLSLGDAEALSIASAFFNRAVRAGS